MAGLAGLLITLASTQVACGLLFSQPLGFHHRLYNHRCCLTQDDIFNTNPLFSSVALKCGLIRLIYIRWLPQPLCVRTSNSKKSAKLSSSKRPHQRPPKTMIQQQFSSANGWASLPNPAPSTQPTITTEISTPTHESSPSAPSRSTSAQHPKPHVAHR